MSDSNPTNVVLFANAAHDNTLWTPEQCAEEFLRDLRSGEAARSATTGEQGAIRQLIISYYIEGADGRIRPAHYIAGMTNAEYVALLTLALHKGIEDWRSG